MTKKSRILDELVDKEVPLEVKVVSTSARKPLVLTGVLLDYDSSGLLCRISSDGSLTQKAVYVPRADLASVEFSLPMEMPVNPGAHPVGWSDDYKSIAEALTGFREQAGLTKTQAARISGISMRSVQYAESGANIKKSTLDKYLTAFDVPPEALRKLYGLL